MLEKNIEISWLKTFIWVAKTGSMTKATDAICRSQAAVSMHIKKIELVLGRKVFYRGVRNLTLTPTGKELLEYANEILSVYSEAMHSLTGSNLSGKISFGIPDDYAIKYLPNILDQFAKNYPFIELSIICEPSLNLIPKIEEGLIDVALVTKDSSNRENTLFSEPLVWVAKQEVNISKDRVLDIALYEYGSEARFKVIEALNKLDGGYRIAYSSPYVAGQIAIVESGIAIAVLTQCSVPQHLTILSSKNLPNLPKLDITVISSKLSPNKIFNNLLVDEIQKQFIV